MKVDFVCRFDREYGPKLGIRATTFRAVIRESLAQGVTNIVETGCMRKEDNWAGDGQSTIIWTDYCQCNDTNFVTIDSSQEAVSLVRKICPTAASICGDSVAELSKIKKPIDLLYLDSFDLDMANPHPAALHCLMEFCSAKAKFREGSIVFVDDCPISNDGVIGGKGMYVARYLKQLGILPFTSGYQAAWLMP